MTQDLRNITFHMKTLGGKPPELRLVCDGVRDIMEAREEAKLHGVYELEEEEEQVRQALALSIADASCCPSKVEATNQCKHGVNAGAMGVVVSEEEEEIRRVLVMSLAEAQGRNVGPDNPCGAAVLAPTVNHSVNVKAVVGVDREEAAATKAEKNFSRTAEFHTTEAAPIAVLAPDAVHDVVGVAAAAEPTLKQVVAPEDPSLTAEFNMTESATEPSLKQPFATTICAAVADHAAIDIADVGAVNEAALDPSEAPTTGTVQLQGALEAPRDVSRARQPARCLVGC
jgi:hypothetical protein